MKVAVVKDHFDVMSSGDVQVAVTRSTVTSTLASAQVQFNVKREVRELPLTIHFNGNGGTPERETSEAIVGGKIGELPTASRGTWFFDGWYTSATGGTLVTKDTIVSSSVENLYAHWIEAVTIAFDPNGGTLTGSTTILAYQGKPLNASGIAFPTAIGPSDRPNLSGWFTSADGGVKLTPDTAYDGTYTTIYPHYVAQSFAVDLSDGWCLSDESGIDPNGNYAPYQANPDSSQFDGVYQSYGNWNVDASTFDNIVRMRITFNGYSTFRIRAVSSAESGWDGIAISNLDTPLEITDSGQLEWERFDPETVYGYAPNSYNEYPYLDEYALFEFINDGGEHFIEVAFSKDSSYNDMNDRGYVLIERS